MTQASKYKDITSDFLINPKHRFARHFLLILSIIFIACQSINFSPGQIGKELLNAVLSAIMISGLIYFNVYVLAPKFLLKNRIFAYTSGIIGIILFVILLISAIQLLAALLQPGTSRSPSAWIVILNIGAIITQFGLLIAGTSTVLLFRQWISTEQRINALENLNMQSELEQLKNQINPHFLFNMLNNANVLTKKNPKEAADVLSKLKDLLQYQVNVSSKELVELTSDIRFLTDFLNLEKVRRDKFEFIIKTEGNAGNTTVPSLLFIPFVENAVKHNNDSTALSYVHLCFSVENNWLKFTCINSKPAQPQQRRESGGLGLVNIKRRLELLFDENYSLNISENEITYTVNLKIKL